MQAQDAANDLLGRINNLRASLGLSAYRFNGALNVAASNHANWMASTDQVSHVQPDGSRPRDRAQSAGYGSAWVAENIYMGWNANTGDAWQFWVNSPVHYAGLTSPNFRDIGIARAQSGNNTAFVLVFGNPGGGASAVSGGNANAGNNANNASASSGAVPGLPIFVVGTDSVGNIMHEVQAGDTLGDIAFIYGYSWEDIPTLLDLNGMSDNDIRVLEIGSIFLVPPFEGTYTPTPPEETATFTATPTSPFTATPSPTATLTSIPTDAEIVLPPPMTFVVPTETPSIRVRTIPTATSIAVAQVATPTSIEPTEQSNSDNAPPIWLIAFIIVQVVVIGFASFQLIRRR